MTDIKVYGELLATEDNRVLRYRLLPFGSIGRTNVGAVLASADSVEIPEDLSHLTLNLEHNQMAPVGRFVEITKADDGLYATVSISKFKRGDEALSLTASKALTGISVEVAGAIIQDGKLVGGELVGAALCKTPAFPDALLMASNTDDVQEALTTLQTSLDSLSEALGTTSETPVEEEIESPEEDPEVHPFTDSSEEEEDPKKGLTAMENSAIPSALTASNGGSAEINDLATGTALIAKAFKQNDRVLLNALEEVGAVGERNLFAALTPVTSANGAATSQPTWLGEAWTGKAYQRKITTLVNNKPLTGRTMQGWRFVTKPEVAAYAGFPAQIPTNAVTTESFTLTSERWAGGNDLDRAFIDFNDTEFLQAFYRAQAESYARVTDLRVLTAINSNAAAINSSAAVPAGVAAAAVHIVDGALEMIEFATPTAALVPATLYRELLLTKENDSLKYLESALGLEGGGLAGFQIVPVSDTATDGQVIVLAKEAVTFYELGGSPIRAQVDNPSIGGFTTALFGYTAVDVDSRGVVAVGAYVAP